MAIRNIRLGDQEFKIEEWLHWPEFSTIEGQAGANVNLRAFSYVVGQLVPQAGTISTGRRRATVADTNRTTRSRMNKDEALIIFSLTYEPFAYEGTTNSDSQPYQSSGSADTESLAPAFTGRNLRVVQRDMMFDLMIGANISKPMAQAPVAYIGQGIGAVAYGAGDAFSGITAGGGSTLNFNYGTGGEVHPKRNQRSFQLPVLVESDRVMYLHAYTPAGNLTVDQDWQLRIYLDGLKKRPVA